MIHPSEWDKFFEKYAERGNVSDACLSSGVSRTVVYAYLRGEFPEEFDDAARKLWKQRHEESREAAADKLESEAFRRAHDGYLKKSYTIGGGEGAEKHVEEWAYSDSLMVVLLRANRPERFKEKTATELTGPNGGPIKTETKVIAVPAIEENAPE